MIYTQLTKYTVTNNRIVWKQGFYSLFRGCPLVGDLTPFDISGHIGSMQLVCSRNIHLWEVSYNNYFNRSVIYRGYLLMGGLIMGGSTPQAVPENFLQEKISAKLNFVTSSHWRKLH